ncbi:SMP-30/gluconolactonase/LRE family protein [Burkholderia sp. Bp9140]|nr:SMP-30/gluconolactonase/LRE family protein [Burkholderia sp. Bp9140]
MRCGGCRFLQRHCTRCLLSAGQRRCRFRGRARCVEPDRLQGAGGGRAGRRSVGRRVAFRQRARELRLSGIGRHRACTQVRRMNATCLVDARNTLGEGCVWDPRDDSLYWTDIEESRIYRLSSAQEVTSYALPERAGFIVPRKDAGFIVGLASRIARVDAGFSRFDTVTEVEPALAQTRVNDAAVDPFGGIVFGTFDERDRQPVASLYRLSPEGELRQLLRDVTISNGIAFSPDGQIMYFADTPVGVIRRFKVGAAFASLDEIEPLAAAQVAPGSPDGAIVDRDGGYWSARVWGGCVVRLSADGAVTDRIDLPTKGPTCVALGGPAGNRLFITTLRVRHTQEELDSAPHAGGLFVADVAVPAQSPRLALL